jgi:hypothetical protein
MANGFYDAGLDAFVNGSIDWVNDDIRMTLVDAADYTVNLTTDNAYDDVPAGARVATMAASMAGKTTDGAGGVDATDVTYTGVSGDQSEALVIYKHNATESLATLICYLDGFTGLPVTPNGGDITVQFHASGIFSL